VKFRILIADDHQLVVQGIVHIVESECEIVGMVKQAAASELVAALHEVQAGTISYRLP
jgi:DNA-binding NarL/FixJ family response regulator